jgi:hypothetical protein
MLNAQCKMQNFQKNANQLQTITKDIELHRLHRRSFGTGSSTGFPSWAKNEASVIRNQP